MLLLCFEWVDWFALHTHLTQSIQRRITHQHWKTHASRLPIENASYQLTLQAHCVITHSLKCTPPPSHLRICLVGCHGLLLGCLECTPAYRLFPTQFPMDVFVVPWKEDGQDIRDFFSPGRSLVSTASERSMCRWWCRSVSEYPRCLILIGVRGCLHRCCGGFRVACPSRGTGRDRDRLFFEHGGGSIIVQKKKEKIKNPFLTYWFNNMAVFVYFKHKTKRFMSLLATWSLSEQIKVTKSSTA